jgi:hypothetical protein
VDRGQHSDSHGTLLIRVSAALGIEVRSAGFLAAGCATLVVDRADGGRFWSALLSRGLVCRLVLEEQRLAASSDTLEFSLLRQ